MDSGRQETIAYIIKEARGVFDELLKHGYKVVSVDRMADIIDRIEAAAQREREDGGESSQICGEIGEMIGREEVCKQSVTNCNRLGNVAKMREALINAYYAMFKFIKTPYAECDEMASALDGAIAALATPPRNCDRAECATTKSAQAVWRKEDGGKTAYYEWLLETSTKGEENENS